MNLESILRKFVRLPWEVCDGKKHCKDEEISNYVAFHGLAGTKFREPPKEGDEKRRVLFAIANAMTIALTTQGGTALTQRNKFPGLQDEEKKFLFDALGIDPLCHDSILYISKKDVISAELASYVAASYAFTTWTKPFVLNFERLCSVAFQSMRDTTSEEKLMKTAGLLIVTDLGVPTKMNEAAYAFLQNILAMRSSAKRMNMFFDTRHGKILSTFLKGKVPSREDVTETYLSMFPVSYRIDTYLVGEGVHIIPGIDPVKRQIYEY